MKLTLLRAGKESLYAGGAAARYRFALGGLALALAAGLGTPALARALAQAWGLPVETVLIGVGVVVALAFLVAGWVLGRRVDALAEEARRDPMTRVGNRRHWEESLAHEVASAVEARMPLAILMLDLDNLKQVNDAGGHGAGDRALAVVGEVLNETCRSRDIAARFGGDEFALLLPRTRASEARVLAERIRSEIARRRASLGAPLERLLTVSIGISDLASVGEPRPAVLVEAADRALYVAKQSGRDRIEVAEKTPTTSTVIVLDERRRRARRTRFSR